MTVLVDSISKTINRTLLIPTNAVLPSCSIHVVVCAYIKYFYGEKQFEIHLYTVSQRECVAQPMLQSGETVNHSLDFVDAGILNSRLGLQFCFY